MSNAEENPQTDQEKAEEALVSQWTKRLEERVEKHDKDARKNIQAWRKYVKGRETEGKEADAAETIALIYSVFSTLIPQLYAKDPEIDCRPSEAVNPAQYELWRKFCQTMQVLLNRLLVDEGRLKKRSKSAVRATMTSAIGWVKVIYQRDYREDPVIKSRLEDTQDNLALIERLIKDLDDPQKAGDYDAKRQELKQSVESLQAQVEIVASEGIVIDRPLTEDIIILDDSITDFDDYVHADAIAHRLWFTKEKFEETFGIEPTKEAWRYKKGTETQERDNSGTGDDKDCLFPAFEIWSKRHNTVFWAAPGHKRWLRKPMVPQRQGRRWYPFFGMIFNPIDGQFQPLSDVYLLKKLQDEYNDMRKKQRNVREDNRPGIAYRRGGGLDEEDIENLQNREEGDVIGVGGDPDRPLSNDLFNIPDAQYDPRMYDSSPIMMDVEQLSGASDASRNVIQNAKTATEAEIMSSAMQGRLGDRRDVLEDWLTEMAQYAAEVLLLELSQEQVMQIAGPSAIWPKMSREAVYEMFRVEIRSGSTIRPNKSREQEQWVQLLPVLQPTLMQFIELQGMGHPAAKVLEFVIEQTLQRFDERFDLSEIMPAQQGMPPMLPGMPGNQPINPPQPTE